jgi:hypothetical protein
MTIFDLAILVSKPMIDIMFTFFTITRFTRNEKTDFDVCFNNNFVSDVNGDTCSSYYDYFPDGCGNYDNEGFIAADSCCACGGGGNKGGTAAWALLPLLSLELTLFSDIYYLLSLY